MDVEADGQLPTCSKGHQNWGNPERLKGTLGMVQQTVTVTCTAGPTASGNGLIVADPYIWG